MIEVGTVVAVRGDKVDVSVGASPSCAGCNACSMGSSAEEMLLRDVVDPLGVALGDRVEVVISEQLRMQAALAIYVVPLGALFVGYVVGSALGEHLDVDADLIGALLGIAAATAAFMGAQVRERMLSRKGRFAPRVRAIIAPGPEQG
ncbi:MAG: SoxR reducing system RseC family protein [Coriobacteriales bacterium]|nr:SoxR reducing system RseC family protein [Actinomycetes bacterium]